MKGWMESLVLHYEEVRKHYPEDKLMILFDVDGTVVDMRYAVAYVLKSFDRYFHTRFFQHLEALDITLHENRIDDLLSGLDIPGLWRKDVLEWYKWQYWATKSIVNSHRAFDGVMAVIGWFHRQGRTFVGLNTGRPECLRRATLFSLNDLGRDEGVIFRGEHLHMNRGGWHHSVPSSKVEGLYRFRASGYRVFAMVDNEPINLEAIAREDPEQEILLLHADTLFESNPKRLPSRAVAGRVYDPSALFRVRAMRHEEPILLQKGFEGPDSGNLMLAGKEMFELFSQNTR